MAKIRSKNELFRGKMIVKPKQAIVAGEDAEGFDIFQCPNCGNRATAEDCDVCGAEPDCLFCNQCNREFHV